MKTSAPIPNTFVARPMIPLIEAAARKLHAVAKVNRDVHIAVYNTLIAEVAAEAAAKEALKRAAEMAL
jgi:hypothetical protein